MKIRTWFTRKDDRDYQKDVSVNVPVNNSSKVSMDKHIGEKNNYLHPKIMLVNIESNIFDSLKNRGFNVSQAVLFDTKNGNALPHDYKEQEVIVVDHNYKEINIGPSSFSGVSYLANDFNRILNFGGVYIIFAGNPKLTQVANSNMLSILRHMDIGNDRGSEIKIPKKGDKNSPLNLLMAKHLAGAKYHCTLGEPYTSETDFLHLLENKYGASVGVVITPKNETKSFVFIFPDFENKQGFLIEFIEQILPYFTPQLFPDFHKATWVKLQAYELPFVAALKRRITLLREENDRQIAKIESEIFSEKAKNEYLFNLACETGDKLVESVKKALGVLGFTQVTDVDEQLMREAKQKQKREDLQIHDYSPTLICEVKGINYFPSDDDALAVNKYVTLRSREWDRTNVRGLAIINHQRNLPPLDRNHEMPFRQEILDTAEEDEIGLITGWDLHRLTRSFIQNKWTHESVKDLFYKSGRIEPIPSHYEYIGKIERFMENIRVVGIKIENSRLRKGERVSFELPVVFEEQSCSSLQEANKEIEEAAVGMVVGVKTDLTKEQARIGVRVFRILSELPERRV